MKRKPKKLRRPKTLRVTPEDVGTFEVGAWKIATPYRLWCMKSTQARKLSYWLIRAADYLDGK